MNFNWSQMQKQVFLPDLINNAAVPSEDPAGRYLSVFVSKFGKKQKKRRILNEHTYRLFALLLFSNSLLRYKSCVCL